MTLKGNRCPALPVCQRWWPAAVVGCLWAATAVRAAEPLALSGITRPFREETLSSSVPGTVMRILVQEGDRVEPGQVVLELDREQETLEVARRRLIWESRAELESAIAKVAASQVDLEATRRVYEATKSVSKEELSQKELVCKLAVAEQRRLEVGEEREKIEYQIAQEQLRRRSLVAPSAGTITKKSIEEGENCEPRQPLLHLVDTRKCFFVANAEAKVACLLEVGRQVDLVIEAGGGLYRCQGQICFLSPVVDAASGLQEVKALFENPEGRVRPGVAGHMQFTATAHE